MRQGEGKPESSVALRSSAEKKLMELKANGQQEVAEKDLLKIVHELQVHQVELQMQNEELRTAGQEVDHLLNKYTELYDFAPVGYFTLDKHGLIVEANLAGARMFDLERGSLIGRRFDLFISQESRQEFASYFETLYEVDTIQICSEVKITADNKTIIYAQIEGIVLQNREQILIALIDITEGKKSKEALEKLEHRNELILNSAGEGIFGLDLEGHHTFVNPSAAKMLGYAVTELIGRHSHSIWHHTRSDGSPYPEQECPIYEALKDGSAHIQENEIFWRKDGSRFPVRYTLTPIIESNIITGAVVSFRDITDRKLVQKELEDEIDQRKKAEDQLRNLYLNLQGMREEERANIAREIHDELGQIMTAVKMDVAWIKGKYSDHKAIFEKTSATLNLIDATIKSIKKICTELRPGILDHLGLVAAIKWQAQEFQNRTGIECKAALEEDIEVDSDRSTALFRIFQEALTNVLRHANATKVAASLKEKNGKVILEVSDNGKGITEEKIARPNAFGLLGMRERVYPWGGDVSIRGRPNKGTIITISFPIE